MNWSAKKMIGVDYFVLEIFPKCPEPFKQAKLGSVVIKRTVEHGIGGGSKRIEFESGGWGLGAKYNSQTNTVELFNSVFVDVFRGHGIGTFLMNQVIVWAHRFDGATFVPISLLEGQADDANRARRNRFYMRYGFEFDFGDTVDRVGYSKPILVSKLETVKKPKNIKHSFIHDFVHRQDGQIDFLRRDVEFFKRNAQEARSDYKRLDNRPVVGVIFSRVLRSAAKLFLMQV